MKNQLRHQWPLCVIFYCHAFLAKTCAGCYFPNGTDRNVVEAKEVYLPCDPGDADSMCCALNRASGPDKCRSDGLCYSHSDGNIWRESCTDRSWKSPKCVKLCDAGIGQYFEGKDIQLADHDSTITPCGDGSYCCGNGTIAQTCCDKKIGVFPSNGGTTSQSPSGTLSFSPTTSLPFRTTSEAITQTSNGIFLSNGETISGNPSETLSSSPTRSLPLNTQTALSSKNNTGAIVGGVIGGIIILLLIIGIILILVRWNQHGHAGSESKIPHKRFEADGTTTLALSVPQEVPAAHVSRKLEARQTYELEHREARPGYDDAIST